MRMHCNRQSRGSQRTIAEWAGKVGPDEFFNRLTDNTLLEVVEAQLPAHRERSYPPTQVLAMFLAQVLDADGSCQQVVNGLAVSQSLCGMTPVSCNTGGYCQARQRLPKAMVRALVEASGTLLEERTPAGWRWRDRAVKLVDGTTISMPDTPANQAHFGQHALQQSGTGFPMARLATVISLGTGALLRAAIGPFKGKGSGEYSLFRPLQASFERGDVMLADAYYCSYFLIADLLRRGVDAVLAQHDGRLQAAVRTRERLGRGDYVLRWTKSHFRPEWMSREEYLAYPEEITLRQVRVGQKVLITTLLDVPKGALEALYWSRWNVELDLRNIKATLGMDVLRCKTPAMCEKEVWVYFLAYNLIRLLMAEAALSSGVLPRQLSFKHTVQIWVAWSQRQFLSSAAEDTGTLFRLIAQVRVGNRPGRSEPRARKRRPRTNIPRLQRPRPPPQRDRQRLHHLQALTG